MGGRLAEDLPPPEFAVSGMQQTRTAIAATNLISQHAARLPMRTEVSSRLWFQGRSKTGLFRSGTGLAPSNRTAAKTF